MRLTVIRHQGIDAPMHAVPLHRIATQFKQYARRFNSHRYIHDMGCPIPLFDLSPERKIMKDIAPVRCLCKERYRQALTEKVASYVDITTRCTAKISAPLVCAQPRAGCSSITEWT